MSTDIKYVEAYNRHKEVQISRLRLGEANTNHRLFILKRHVNGLCNKYPPYYTKVRGDELSPTPDIYYTNHLNAF